VTIGPTVAFLVGALLSCSAGKEDASQSRFDAIGRRPPASAPAPAPHAQGLGGAEAPSPASPARQLGVPSEEIVKGLGLISDPDAQGLGGVGASSSAAPDRPPTDHSGQQPPARRQSLAVTLEGPGVTAITEDARRSFLRSGATLHYCLSLDTERSYVTGDEIVATVKVDARGKVTLRDIANATGAAETCIAKTLASLHVPSMTNTELTCRMRIVERG